MKNNTKPAALTADSKPSATPPEYASLQSILEQFGPQRAVEEGVRRITHFEYVSPEDLRAPGLSYEIADGLRLAGGFVSVSAAAEFIDILAREAAGETISLSLKGWLSDQRQQFARARQLSEWRARGMEEQRALLEAERQVQVLGAVVCREESLVKSYSCVHELGAENYASQFLSEWPSHFNRVGFMSQWLAERELLRYTRDEVLPSLRSKLAVAEAKLAELRAAAQRVEQLPASAA